MVKRGSRRETPNALFCDASFLIAYLCPKDQDHARAIHIRRRLAGCPIRLYTSWPTVSEAVTLLFYHYGYFYASALLQTLAAFELATPSEGDYYQAAALFQEFNRDQKLSFNDCLTYVLIKGPLRNISIVTFDRDFAKMGLTIFRP
ncbi:MAG: type II toxin-antitoxin system VapC family toxin [Deltaproteobacteria bacterium]|nr:type II toxin-antitoxin system VapC family toxin [Deltaproteobacteria bacterium]